MRHTLEGGGHVVGDVVSTSDEALSSAAREVPGLAVVKIPAVGWEDGVGLVCRLRSHFGVPSVVITDAEGLACVIGAAAAGIVVKPFHKGQLLSAVAIAQRRDDSAHSPERRGFIAPAAGSRNRFAEVARAVADPATHQWILTPRELEVVRLLMANGRVRTIAEQRHVSLSTVRNQLRSVFRKLGVHFQVELIQSLQEQRT